MTRGPKRFLLPHERLLVGWILGNQQKRPNATIVAAEKRYGPDGMIWLDAGYANLPFGLICAVAVFVIIFTEGTTTSKIGLYLFAAMAGFFLLYFVRVIQASRAGRKFRGEGH